MGKNDNKIWLLTARLPLNRAVYVYSVQLTFTFGDIGESFYKKHGSIPIIGQQPREAQGGMCRIWGTNVSFEMACKKINPAHTLCLNLDKNAKHVELKAGLSVSCIAVNIRAVSCLTSINQSF
jgi:hypothetical protein